MMEKYGTGIKDILNRIETTNRELKEISRKVDTLDKNVSVLNERTKIMLNIQYALIGDLRNLSRYNLNVSTTSSPLILKFNLT